MCGSFPGLLIGRTAVHSGKDPAFVAYDQYLSTGILQPLSRGEVRGVIRVDIAVSAVMSAIATSGLMQCSRPQLFDHLVGAGEQRRRNIVAERFGGFEG